MKKQHYRKCYQQLLTTLLITFLLALFSIVETAPLYASNLNIFALTKEKGILISYDNGDDWEKFNKGLPAGIIPIRIYSAKGTLYLTTTSSGIFRLSKNKTWANISSPDFRVRSQYNKTTQYRKISAFSFDRNNPSNIVLATKHTIYRSTNSGKNWRKIPAKGLHKRNYITALAINKKNIYAGTSFNGFFKLNYGRFKKINKGLPAEPYSGNLSFKEEISTITFENKPGSTIYTGLAFGGGVYYKKPGSNRWKNLKLPAFKDKFFDIYDIKPVKKFVYITLDSGIYKIDKKTGEWYSLSYKQYLGNIPGNVSILSLFVTDSSNSYPPLFYKLNNYQYKNRTAAASNKRALYASVPLVRRKLNRLIKTIKKSGKNAVVIDMKDDVGNLYFKTNNKTAIKIRAARKPLDTQKILKKFKENGIYTIARVVVFKDKKLFRGYNYKYAIRNTKGKPWRGNTREYWVDPHSKFVQRYNIDLSKELEAIGFDEIQFDYIRFPSDGPTHLCRYKYRKDKDTYKSEILADFLRMGKKEINIPISVDIYGFNSWYSFGNWIGQDMEEFSRIVDVICPMVYPSHFGNRFYMKKGKRALRPYRIVYDGGKRAVKIAGQSVVIRPYLQAFRMSSPTWGPGYINNQVKASDESGCSGYTFWNARGDYKMVERAYRVSKPVLN